MTRLLDIVRRTALVAIAGSSVLAFGAARAIACDCAGNSYGDRPDYQQSYDDYPCYGDRADCGFGRYDRRDDNAYLDSYYAYARLDPYRYYNPDYDDDAYYDEDDCDGDGC